MLIPPAPIRQHRRLRRDRVTRRDVGFVARVVPTGLFVFGEEDGRAAETSRDLDVAGERDVAVVRPGAVRVGENASHR